MLSSSVSKERIDPGPHAFIHPDERRPGTFEAFTGQFLRRVNAEFAAAGNFAGGWSSAPGGPLTIPPSS
jgi:hypothetical protein